MVTIIAANTHALHEYEILEKYEAGIVLFGHEVKSVKLGHINLKGAYVSIIDGELFLINAHVPLYHKTTLATEYDPYRSRKLLLNRREVATLIGAKSAKGLTIIPLSVYSAHGKIKVEIGVGRGRKKFEKRELIKKRETEREMRKAMKSRIGHTP